MNKHDNLNQVMGTLPDDIQDSFRTYVLTGVAPDDYKRFQKSQSEIASVAEEHALGLMIAAFREASCSSLREPLLHLPQVREAASQDLYEDSKTY